MNGKVLTLGCFGHDSKIDPGQQPATPNRNQVRVLRVFYKYLVRLQYGPMWIEEPDDFPYFSSGQQRIGRRVSLNITAHFILDYKDSRGDRCRLLRDTQDMDSFLSALHVGTPVIHTTSFTAVLLGLGSQTTH